MVYGMRGFWIRLSLPRSKPLIQPNCFDRCIRKPLVWLAGLCKTTLFPDGNKRIGAHAMLVFLALNGISLSYTQDELSSVFLKMAAGAIDYDDLLQWVIDHEKSEED